MQHKLKRRLSAALMAGAMCCTMIPIASADEIATPETADAAVPEVTDNATPDISQITENLYNDLPDAPTGSYLGSMGLPVATGETKISISAWVSDLYDGADAHLDADALNEDETTITIGKIPMQIMQSFLFWFRPSTRQMAQQQKLYCQREWRFSATHLLMQASFLPVIPSSPKSCIRLTPSNLRLQQAFM